MPVPGNELDILKVLYCVPFLVYACWTDWRERRVSNRLWIVMAGFGTVFAVIEVFGGGFLRLVVSVGFIFIFVYLAFEFGLFGGADAKALIVLAYLFSDYPSLSLMGVSMPAVPPLHGLFALSVLGNGLVFSLAVPLVILARNLKDRVNSPLHYIFMGYRLPVSKLEGHLRMMEEPVETENGVEWRYRRGGIPLEEGIAKLRKLTKDTFSIDPSPELQTSHLKQGQRDYVWVTPALPFIIPLTLGFFTAVFYGDLVFGLVKEIYLLF